MDKRIIVRRYLVIALLLCPLSAAATTGVPGGLVILPLALFFPFLAMFLLMEVKLRRIAKPTKWGTVRIVLIALVSLFYVTIYLDGFINDSLDGESALILTSVLFVLSLGFICIYVRNVWLRVFVMFAVLILLATLNVLTTSVVCFDYYKFVDNEPIANPTNTIEILDDGYAQLSDGRIFYFKKGAYNTPRTTPATMIQTGVNSYRFFVKSKSGLTPSELRKYKRDTSALIHVPKHEIAINNYMRRELGEGVWVGKKKESELKLIQLAIDKRCPTEQMKTLLDSGVDPNVFNTSDRYLPVLIYSVASGCTGVVKVLIEAGADVNAVDTRNRSVLHDAVDYSWNRDDKIVGLLLLAGANLQAKDNDNNTPLHIAAKTENYSVIKMLVDAGSDKTAVNNKGETPLDVALQYYKFNTRVPEQEKELILELLR